MESSLKIDLTIKNYRSFSENNPAKISIRNGVTSLIGINNSGKSSLLKLFYEFRDIFRHLSNYQSVVQSLRHQTSFNFPETIYDIEEVFNNKNDHNLSIEIETEQIEPNIKPEPIKLKQIITVFRGKNQFFLQIEIDGTIVAAGDIAIASDRFTLVRPYSLNLGVFYQISNILSNSLYIGPFRNALNLGDQPNYYDISAGQSFIKLWRRVKEGNSKKENRAATKIEKDIQSIFDFESIQINPSDQDQTLSVTINGDNFKLPELGAGITQFIVVLVNSAIKSPALILIDEPELNLHPSLQLDFVTTLASYSSYGLILATHSIGLARSVSDSMYSVSKNTDNESDLKIYEDTPQLVQFLGELSYSGYKNLGYDKILLVEGKHDIKTFQQFLRIFKSEHKVVILPLDGGNLGDDCHFDQLSELKRISENIYVIVDSEKSSKDEDLSQDRKKFKENCKKLKIECHILEKRAIENYLTDRAIKLEKGDKYKELEPYQKRDEVNPIWGKQENWRIARQMSSIEILNTDFGKFLKRKLT